MKNEQIKLDGLKKAILYTRVSTTDQAENGFSLDHQQKIARAYCDIREINIVKLWSEDYSAKSFEDRPQWKILMEFIIMNKKSIDFLVFTKWDRFSRNAEESWKMIKKIRNLGIEIICIEQPLDLDNPESKLLLAVYLIIPEMENDKISSRTRDGVREGQRQGFWMGTPPIGYNNKRDENEKSTLELNYQAPLVKESFELISTGLYACEEVRREINKKWNTKMCKQSFINMLRNICYAGKILIKEWKKEEEQVVQGAHKPIISIELYREVQDVLTGRRKQPKFHLRKSESLPLRGHLKCSKCGGNLTGSGSTGRAKIKHWYYHCQRGCTVRFRADEANTIFLEHLVSIRISEHVKNLYRDVMKDIHKQNEGDKSKKIAFIMDEITKIRSRKENAQDKLVDGTDANGRF
jgi:site-specific DNA recombinase